MNLAASVNVLLYDRLAKTSQIVQDNELIRRSRDNKNRLKVKESNTVDSSYSGAFNHSAISP